MRGAFVAARIALGLAVAAAIIAQLHSSLGFYPASVRATVLVNFFSYFTIDSNLLTVVMFVAGAWMLARGRSPEPLGFTVFRLAVTTYMVITGVVYNLLLRAEAPSGAVVGWSNEVLHVVAPAYVLLDWLLAPDRRPVRPRAVLVVAGFPLVWAVYTLLRGPIGSNPDTHASHWYPYPFIDPVSSPGGYASVAAYVVGIAIVVIAVAWGLAWASRRWRPALG